MNPTNELNMRTLSLIREMYSRKVQARSFLSFGLYRLETTINDVLCTVFGGGVTKMLGELVRDGVTLCRYNEQSDLQGIFTRGHV